MTRGLSPEGLDLQRSEMSEILAGLTEAQKTVLRIAHERCESTAHSGRGGWNVRTMRALEKVGCVKPGKEYRWDMNWSVTTRGMSVGRLAHEQWLESFRTKRDPAR